MVDVGKQRQRSGGEGEGWTARQPAALKGKVALQEQQQQINPRLVFGIFLHFGSLRRMVGAGDGP